MTTRAHDPDREASKDRFIQNVRRVACVLARTQGAFDADDLWQHIPAPPPGVDARNVGGALHGLRALGLIEPVAYLRLDVRRAHGRPQALWRVLDPDGCG